jgi:His/Glu/Gln/Arg/opine family amino acid ABC transporter permease subunit
MTTRTQPQPDPMPDADAIYVAPPQSPQTRRPPVQETGIISWLRHNLFSNTPDTVISIVTLGVVTWFLINFFRWALLEAQWEIVFLNLRVLNVGQQFPQSAVWRTEVAFFIIIFMALLSVGLWGRIRRAFGVILAVIAIAMIIVPPLSETVPEPPVYTYLEPGYPIRYVNFTAEEGQQLTFSILPQTDPADYNLATFDGYVENDNQQANTTFDAFSGAITEVVFLDQRDPSEYDMNAAVQVLDREGNVLAQSDFTEGTTEDTVFQWTAPTSGWFTYTAVLDEENPGESGVALLQVDNLEIYRSTVTGQQERAERYGPAPTPDCRNCATQANRTDMRYEGERTLGQFFSLQLTPLILETRIIFFISLVVGTIGYYLGRATKKNWFQNFAIPARVERGVALAGAALFVVYVLAQLTGFNGSTPTNSTLYLLILGALCLTVILYALILLFKAGSSQKSTGVALLWAISFPIILTLINGVAGVSNLRIIRSDEQGGLLLTLLLSAVAIIASFPIGLLLALGRQSKLPVVSFFCTLFIEVVRGVPLITLLFMGRLILPFFGAGLQNVDLLIRIMVVLTLFTSAYLAEVIRGGLQTIPHGQFEAAHAVGLNDFFTNVLIIIPQALRSVIPAIMGQAISLFKDTSLVYIIGLYELVGTMDQLLGDSQTGYLMFPREGSMFVGVVFFIISYFMAEASRNIEKTGSGAIRRETV